MIFEHDIVVIGGRTSAGGDPFNGGCAYRLLFNDVG
jgi:hypothetical protein